MKTLDGKKTWTGIIVIAIAWAGEKLGFEVADSEALSDSIYEAAQFIGLIIATIGTRHKELKEQKLRDKKLPG